MSTIIYPSPIFGPVNSRRLGVSLGINLMPSDGKVCSFDCVYCECGFNADFRPKKKRPTREEVREGLEKVLKERHDNNQPLDDITFAGNGEPPGHPDFKGIVEDTMELCKKYFPEAQVSVLSNATYIYKEEVREALMLVDNNILKLDTVDMDYIKKLDRPQQPNYDVKDVIKYLKMFKGHVIIQTMFLRGDGLDNTSEHFVAPWLEAVKDIQPQQVMVYTIARETPDKLLEKAPKEVLDAIKERVEALGINLMPSDGKVCSFDCVYCECGFNADFRPKKKRPTRGEVREGLEKVLKERHDNNQPLDDITFAGNGEPTGHPDFKGIVEDTMELCKKYFPEAQVSVLSNATYIYKEEVREALMLVDNNILKLDTVDMDYIKKLDRPQQPNYDVKDVIKYLKMFKGHVIIQTMFLRGDGLDNTSEHFVAPWLEAVKDIQPQQVMVYTIARETPDKLLEKAPKEVLDAIKDRVEALGIKCTASY